MVARVNTATVAGITGNVRVYQRFLSIPFCRDFVRAGKSIVQVSFANNFHHQANKRMSVKTVKIFPAHSKQPIIPIAASRAADRMYRYARCPVTSRTYSRFAAT